MPAFANALRFLVALTLVTSVCAPNAFAADAWPTRTVRFIVPLGPGSGVDIGARLFADRLSKRWGKSVVVENRPGGDAMIAIQSFTAAHDDHILLVSPASSFTAHPYLHDKVPYDPADLVPVARISSTVVAVTVPVTLGVNSLKELVALARAKPGALNWTTATGFTDFVFAGFLHSEGLKMTKVAYRDPVMAVNDLAEGRIQVYTPAFAIVRPQVEAGRAKVLAVTNRQRAPALPDIPTTLELGYPTLEFDGLVGLFGTRELSAEARARIAQDVRAVAGDPDIVKQLTATGQFVSPGDGDEFSASIEKQKTSVAAVAKLFGNKPVQ